MPKVAAFSGTPNFFTKPIFHMKKVFFLFAITVFGMFSLRAQTGQGNMIVGGTAGFSSSRTGDYKVSNVNLSPSVRYFVIDRLAVGANLGIGSSNFDGNRTSTLGIGPSVRYYFTTERPMAFFGEAGFNFSLLSYSSDFIDDTNSSGINFGVGGDYFLNDHIAIEALLGLNSEKTKTATKRTNTFGLQFGVVAFIGGGSDK